MRNWILHPQELAEHDLYKILTGLVVPRAIAWVSTLNSAGQANLAPFSYFTIASSTPPMILFCPQLHPDGRAKDTLRNIQAQPEWVVNIVSESMTTAMNITAGAFEPEVDEFIVADLKPAASTVINVPRVARSLAALECRLEHIIELPTSSIVLGRVMCIHMQADVYQDSYVNLDVLQPVGRAAGAEYVRTGDRFSVQRL